jgi:lipase
VRLNTYEFGDAAGRPIVCLHGVSGHGGRFAQLATRLPGFRVIGVDLRGHGYSGYEPPWDIATHVADLVETADSLGIERAAWLGHSFGGRIVAELSTAAPELVERAILLDPAMRIESEIALASAEGTRPDTSFASLEEAVDAKLHEGTLFTTPREIVETEIAAHFEQGDDGRWRARFSRVAAIVAWSEMAAAAPAFPTQPTLLVLGARSWITNTVVPELPSLDVVTVAGGHSVLWDDFDQTASAVARFLG